ncbi:MAG: ChbG/HpnK family deacetylase [Solirubrobacteraceae bacterium]
MLIVNADDFGGNPLATDRILECFDAGAISSASAMVHMRDSRRAAELADGRGLPLGLHLNLTQPFECEDTPAPVRDRQARALRHLASGRSARLVLDPLLLRLVSRCVEDQIDRYVELFGREPTHIDGHNHVHLSPTVMLALPRRFAVRTAESRPDEAAGVGRLLRRTRHALIARLHPTTELFFPLDPLAANPSQAAIDALLRHAEDHSVELMTHPDRDGEHRLLMSRRWLEAVAARRLSCFTDFPQL